MTGNNLRTRTLISGPGLVKQCQVVEWELAISYSAIFGPHTSVPLCLSGIMIAQYKEEIPNQIVLATANFSSMYDSMFRWSLS